MFLSIAPSGVTYTAVSTTEIAVNFPAQAQGSLLTSFEAKVKGGSQACTVATTVSPLTCSLTGLEAGTKYTISVKSFIRDLVSDPSEGVGYTLPEGKSLTLSLTAKLHKERSALRYIIVRFSTTKR